MSFPEQADFSADHTNEQNIFETISTERDAAGSMAQFIGTIGEQYLASADHRPNMFQLQRMALQVTNPNNEMSTPKAMTEAFYWGEILAYRIQEEAEGETWAKNSYALFSYNSIKMMTEDRDATIPFRQDLQRSADAMVGELEIVDSELLSPDLDAMIMEWAAQTTHNEAEQWYMTLGFRHVMSQVARQAIKMYHQQIIRASEFELGGMDAVAIQDDPAELDELSESVFSIDDYRNWIMESYADHLTEHIEESGAVDLTNAEEVEDLSVYLTRALNRDFNAMEGMQAGDFLEFNGNAVFVIEDGDLRMQAFYSLQEGERLRGTIDGLSVTDTPTFAAIARAREQGVYDTISKEDINLLGVLLVLKDPVIMDAQGKSVPIATQGISGVMLNNPDMHMKKYWTEE